ncbi:MAG TPA: AAA family ATPase [Candidatus Acidoferrales bacterium]|jgi:type II secretory pathway predicted ATPase ExeA|nr:AAA family ATPase [Candidatus Acidoferrales bacterium]
MYKKFFGLRENPFNVNPDPRYLWLNKHTQEALACLTYGVQSRKGFILLTGEVGTGKTTLLNKLLDWLHRERVATAFIFNSKLNVTQFFDFMMADFGIPTETRLKSQVLMRLNHWLLERYQAGETAVLVVDEAQNLSTQVLEEIRLLTNLETSTDKLLQIVLSGQPELEYKLNQPQLRQLRQRITLRCRTHALSLDETGDYIKSRLQIAGANGRLIFSPEAVETVHTYARGIPRVTNLLCENALISAFVDQQSPIDAATVDEVAREFQLHEVEPTAPAVEQAEPSGENRRLMEALQSLVTLVDHLRRSDGSPLTTRKGSYEPHSRSVEES